ncbi:MAG: hypothetical protein DRJ01_16660 [Bacteroidetes bacterium]|nr:MAG: hypothetical protein DRJ01_16660 [Bacteroidota bacterium]
MRKYILLTTMIILFSSLKAQYAIDKQIIKEKGIKEIIEKTGYEDIYYQFSKKSGDLVLKAKKSNKGEIFFKVEYNYNKKGEIVTTNKFNKFSKSSGLQNSGKEVYNYNSEGLLSEVEKYSWGMRQSDNSIDEIITYEYNSDQSINRITTKKFRSNGTLSSTKETKYVYENNKIEHTIQYYNGKIDFIKKHIYDKGGKIFKIETYYPKDYDYLDASTEFKNDLKFKSIYNIEIESKPRGTLIYKYNNDNLAIETLDVNNYLGDDELTNSFEYSFY